MTALFTLPEIVYAKAEILEIIQSLGARKKLYGVRREGRFLMRQYGKAEANKTIFAHSRDLLARSAHI